MYDMTHDQIERMKRRYNGDNDIAKGDPVVTWADRELLDMLEKLLKRVERLEAAVPSAALPKPRAAEWMQPQEGDFVALINAAGNVTENHTRVERCTGWLTEGYPEGQGSYLIKDPSGEAYAVVRMPEADNDVRRAWQEIRTATA